MDDGFVLKTTIFDLEVAFLIGSDVILRNQFENHFIYVRLHDVVQRVPVPDHCVALIFGGLEINLREQVKI